ncbi:ComEA family DNA-binding protein [Streptomyces sp. NBC_00390]
MALRSPSATSGPGRARPSDSRVRHGRRLGRRRGRHASAASATALRRRADALFMGAARGRGGLVGYAGSGAPGAVADGSSGRRGGAGTGPGRAGSSHRVRAALLDRPEATAVPDRPRDGGGAAGAAGAVSDRAVPGDEVRGGDRYPMWVALRERLPVWVQLRCGLEPRTLAALAVVLVAAAVFAALHFWAGRPQTVRPPELVHQGAAARPGPPAGVPARLPAAEGERAARIVVDVSGKVLRPGVLRLPAGSRVADALAAAGGVRAGTDLTGLNRARVLMDGEQVVVGVPAPPGPVATGPGGAGGPAAGPVSLNSATVEQLETLPGVGPVLAQHIVDHRTQHGGFRSVDELRDVNGIGDRRFADLESLVRP